MKSELGILYLSEHNREVIERMLAANELVFEGLFCAAPHVFVCADHPLADHASVTLEDLEDYPFCPMSRAVITRSTIPRN